MSKTTKSTVNTPSSLRTSDRATPRPWLYGKLSEEILDGMGNPVAAKPDGIGPVEWVANASLIVRAVNRDAVFDELVAALRDIVKQYEEVKERGNQMVPADLADSIRVFGKDALDHAREAEGDI